MITNNKNNPRIVSRDEWLAACKELLAREKLLTPRRDAVSAQRRQVPWVKVEKNHVFGGPHGRETLADLFEGKSRLIIYHFMFDPEWQDVCPRRLYNMDHLGAALAQRDITFAAISHALHHDCYDDGLPG